MFIAYTSKNAPAPMECCLNRRNSEERMFPSPSGGGNNDNISVFLQSS